MTAKAISCASWFAAMVQMGLCILPEAVPAENLAYQPIEIARHSDWRVACIDVVCITESTVVAQDRTWLTTVRIRPDEEGADMQLLVPAGVHLASGLFLEIPGRSVKQADFMRCSIRACEAHLKLDRRELSRLKAGLDAPMRYRPHVGVRPVTFDLSLRGITAALSDATSVARP